MAPGSRQFTLIGTETFRALVARLNMAVRAVRSVGLTDTLTVHGQPAGRTAALQLSKSMRKAAEPAPLSVTAFAARSWSPVLPSITDWVRTDCRVPSRMTRHDVTSLISNRRNEDDLGAIAWARSNSRDLARRGRIG